MIFLEKYLKWRDKHFPVGRILRHTPYVLIFKTTNYCWYQCPHCCENSGPNNPRNFIPAATICNYLDQASRDPWFSKSVVFTGGEIMSAYRFGPADYVPTLLNHSLDLGMGPDIKTNAAWVRAGFGEQIFQDLHHVISTHKPYTMQISLSLDKYHKNALENNAILISRLAKMPNARAQIHLAGFNNHVDMFPALLDAIKSNGITVEEVMFGNIDNMQSRMLVGGQILLNPTKATLFDGGRAQNLDWAHHSEFPQFQFMTADHMSLIAFDSMGRVTLGENSGRKISTKWQESKGDKHLMRVRADLVRATWREETRARLIDGWRFNER